AIMLLNQQRQIIEINPPFIGLLGYTRGALIGRTITDIIAPRERVESAEAWRQFFASGEYSGTRTFVHSSGSEVTMEFAARLSDVGGRRLGVYVADHAARPAGRFRRPGP